MRLCFGCFLRGLSALKLAILAVSVLVILGGSWYFLYRYGVVSEQARLAAKWERLVDNVWRMRPERQ